MGNFVFIIFMFVCVGVIYLVHRYLGKSEAYLLAICYSLIGFITSFKVVTLFGIHINLSIVFVSAMIVLLYYFNRKYEYDDAKNVMFVMIFSTLLSLVLLMVNVFLMPSINDKMGVVYQSLVFDNLAILILYPISLSVALVLANYCFNVIIVEKNKNIVSIILTLIGIVFIYVFLFVYFSYAIIIRFDTAMGIAISSFLVMCLIITLYFLIMDKLFMIRKVKR